MTNSQEQIIAFCCRHSARRAADRAALEGLALPGAVRLVTVPCSGRVSMELILKALEDGAPGVLVLGCHPGACHHLYGSDRARERVTAARQRLQEAGLDPARVAFASLGPDNAADLARLLAGFVAKLNF